jgi:hypothetical protein
MGLDNNFFEKQMDLLTEIGGVIKAILRQESGERYESASESSICNPVVAMWRSKKN